MIEEYQIIVNARPKFISKRLLTRDDLIELAGHNPHDPTSVYYTVRWRSYDDKVGGEIDEDTVFKVQGGAKIDVFFPPAEEPDRGPLVITVAGVTGSGKTAVLIEIANMLINRGFTNLIVDWGPDGNPHRTNAHNSAALLSIAERNPRVIIKEMQLARDGTTLRN